jgi:hypothetical protein
MLRNVDNMKIKRFAKMSQKRKKRELTIDLDEIIRIFTLESDFLYYRSTYPFTKDVN